MKAPSLLKNVSPISASVFIKGEEKGGPWQENNNKIYDPPRWWEDRMLFYIFDIEPKLSHRKEVMNLQKPHYQASLNLKYRKIHFINKGPIGF